MRGVSRRLYSSHYSLYHYRRSNDHYQQLKQLSDLVLRMSQKQDKMSDRQDKISERQEMFSERQASMTEKLLNVDFDLKELKKGISRSITTGVAVGVSATLTLFAGTFIRDKTIS